MDLSSCPGRHTGLLRSTAGRVGIHAARHSHKCACGSDTRPNLGSTCSRPRCSLVSRAHSVEGPRTDHASVQSTSCRHSRTRRSLACRGSFLHEDQTCHYRCSMLDLESHRQCRAGESFRTNLSSARRSAFSTVPGVTSAAGRADLGPKVL